MASRMGAVGLVTVSERRSIVTGIGAAYQRHRRGRSRDGHRSLELSMSLLHLSALAGSLREAPGEGKGEYMVKQAHFGPELFRFLRELAKNNRREWFLTNKERYERDVKTPFITFIGAFAAPLAKISKQFDADPRPV